MAYEIYYSTSAESGTLDVEFVELARKVCKKAISLLYITMQTGLVMS